MSESPSIQMHKVQCPESGDEFYVKVPEDDFPVEKEVTSPADDVFTLEYRESELEDVAFEVKVIDD